MTPWVRVMPTCDFFSSTNHFQSHVQSFGKVLNSFFGICLRCGKFYFDYFERWGNLVYLDFIMNSVMQELAMAPKSKQT